MGLTELMSGYKMAKIRSCRWKVTEKAKSRSINQKLRRKVTEQFTAVLEHARAAREQRFEEFEKKLDVQYEEFEKVLAQQVAISQELNEKLKAINLSMTADAQLWGKQHLFLVAGEVCYLILNKRFDKKIKPSTSFQGLEKQQNVCYVASEMGILPEEFCRLSERCIDRRNASCYFSDITVLTKAVSECVSLVSRHPTLGAIPAVQECLLLFSHFELLRRAFNL